MLPVYENSLISISSVQATIIPHRNNSMKMPGRFGILFFALVAGIGGFSLQTWSQEAALTLPDNPSPAACFIRGCLTRFRTSLASLPDRTRSHLANSARQFSP